VARHTLSEQRYSKWHGQFQPRIEKCYSRSHASAQTKIPKRLPGIANGNSAAKDSYMTGSASNTALPAGFLLRFAAAVIDLAVLAVPFAVFVSFLSVGMRISRDFLALHPGMPPSEVLMRFGPRFLYISLAFFIVLSWAYLKARRGGLR
jgi:hypothetical protein